MEQPLGISTNPYHYRIMRLEDVSELSYWADDAIDILREHFKADPVHNEAHIVRVLKNALWFGQGGSIDVIVPAAILHDLVNVPKDSPDRSKASRMSAELATSELGKRATFRSSEHRAMIFNAIEAHSWSAQVEPLSLEARAIQDADRLEALGALGMARLFSYGGFLNRELLHPVDPLAQRREPDEVKYSLDHYFVKLRHLPNTMRTDRGRERAKILLGRMERFVTELASEI